MLLCLDVGNTHIHAGLFKSNKIAIQFRYSTTSAHATSDQIGIFLRQVIRENKLDPDDISNTAICSVVPSLEYSLTSAIIKYFSCEPFFLKAGVKTGIKLKVPFPQAVGADIIAGLIAANNICPNKNLIMIDMGTATVLAVLTNNSEFIGASIVPGLQTSMMAISSSASQLSTVPIVKMTKAIANTTNTCVQSGLYFSHLGGLKEIISNFKLELNNSPTPVMTIATGGFASIYTQDNIFDLIVPDLVLQGIKIAFDKNNS